MGESGKVWTKSRIAIELSKLEDFSSHDIGLEQYSTPSELAAEIIWDAHMKGDILGKTVLDAACGPGYFGIGALLLGAKKVVFLDLSKEAVSIAKRNYNRICESYGKVLADFVVLDISKFSSKVDTVVMNPPFGTKVKNADKLFLEKAFVVGKVIYSIHKITSKKFISSISSDFGFKVDYLVERDFKIGRTAKFHKKPTYVVKVGVWRLTKG
jgi:putative methylase